MRDPETGNEKIRLNPHFAEFLKEVGVFTEPAHRFSGNQMGSVENLVKFAKGAFFNARRFRNQEDLEWLQYVGYGPDAASVPSNRTTGSPAGFAGRTERA